MAIRGHWVQRLSRACRSTFSRHNQWRLLYSFGLRREKSEPYRWGRLQSGHIRLTSKHRVKPVKNICAILQYLLASVVVAALPNYASAAAPIPTTRLRVLVSSDIGGTDPDDFQSMVHLLGQ